MRVLASSLSPRASAIRTSVPSANEARNFSGNCNFLPISHIRYVDNGRTITHIRFNSKRGREMNVFQTDAELFQAYGKMRGEPKGCAILGKAKALYAPHIYRGGSVVPGWGYSIERISKGYVSFARAGNPAHVA